MERKLTKYSKEMVKYTRTLLEISQWKAAILVGVAFSTWQAYEYGRFKMPKEKWKRWLKIVDKRLREEYGENAKKKRTRV